MAGPNDIESGVGDVVGRTADREEIWKQSVGTRFRSDTRFLDKAHVPTSAGWPQRRLAGPRG